MIDVVFEGIAIDRVLSKLKELNISYQIVYTDRNPLILDFKNKNKYKDFAIKAKSNNELKNKVEYIVSMLETLDDDKLTAVINKIEKLIR